MRNSFVKDTLRNIKNTKGRFVTLIAIVALGVSIFVGVGASADFLRVSVDHYNDRMNLMDLHIYSELGFTEEELEQLRNTDELDFVQGERFVDVLTVQNGHESILRLHELHDEQIINRFELVEGRMPKNKHEILIEQGEALFPSFPLGTTLQLQRPDEDLDDFLNLTEVTVVGKIRTPNYLNPQKESSTLNNRPITFYAYIPSEAFSLDTYIQVLATVKDANRLNSYTPEYEEKIAKVVEKLEPTVAVLADLRRDEIVNEAMEKYEDGLAEYEDGLKTFEQEIADAEKEIRDGWEEVRKGEKELAQHRVEVEAQLTDGVRQIHDGRAQIADGQRELDENKEMFEQKKQEAQAGIVQIQEGLTQIQTGLESYLQNINAQDVLLLLVHGGEAFTGIDEAHQVLDALYRQVKPYLPFLDLMPDDQDIPVDLPNESGQMIIKAGELKTAVKMLTVLLEGDGTDTNPGLASLLKTRDELNQQLASIQAQLTDGQRQLDEAQAQLDKAYEETVNASVAIDEAREEAQIEFAKAEKKLADARADLTDGQKTLEEEREKGQKELDDAKEDLRKAEQDIADIAEGSWDIYDRTKHYSSATFYSTCEQMEAIASVFPLFFFLVAALVCLTTMTRMIEEQRGQLGCYRALGYSDFKITLKYLVYAILASLIGGIIGVLGGLAVFPIVVYNAWGMMYLLPPMEMVIPTGQIVLALISFTLIMVLTTYLACRSSLKEVPGELLRPKAPKVGSKTLLERIPFIWNRFNFSMKVTTRNIFRYKKRFLMTVLGIAGCTALLVTGFGIKDSIQSLCHLQFEEIFLYDGSAVLNDDLTPSQIDQAKEKIEHLDSVQSAILIDSYNTTVLDDFAVTVIVSDPEQIKQVVDLRHRRDGSKIRLDESGVVISEKLSEEADLKIGDHVAIENEKGLRREVVIRDIAEAYVDHYVFMSDAYYEAVFEVKSQGHSVFITAEDARAAEEQLVSLEEVDSVNSFYNLIENFNSMIQGLNIVVIVLIIAAGLLAFVVLGNLTSVNISERQREIATLKVLGFTKKEVNNYVMSENLILTFIGSCFGLLLGKWLHQYIMLLVEMDGIMFGRTISFFSNIISVALTMVFAMIVNWMMTRHLKKIQMVESLKSVE